MCSPLPPAIGLPAAREPRRGRGAQHSADTFQLRYRFYQRAPNATRRFHAGAHVVRLAFRVEVDGDDARSGAVVEELGAPADAAGGSAAVELWYGDDFDFVFETINKLAEAKGLAEKDSVSAPPRSRPMSCNAHATPRPRHSVGAASIFSLPSPSILDALGDPSLRSAEPRSLERFGSRCRCDVGRSVDRRRARYQCRAVVRAGQGRRCLGLRFQPRSAPRSGLLNSSFQHTPPLGAVHSLAVANLERDAQIGERLAWIISDYFGAKCSQFVIAISDAVVMLLVVLFITLAACIGGHFFFFGHFFGHDPQVPSAFRLFLRSFSKMRSTLREDS